MAVPAPISYISCFSGVGMLDLAIERVFSQARPVCYVENEATAALRLAARMATGQIAQAPVWSDIRSFPVELFRGRTDMVVGGFPCTDLSVAGRRWGIRGRYSGLFFDLIRTARDVGARYVFMENVAALTAGRDLGVVLGALAEIGFDARWGCLRASDVGAPHVRDRWWCLAWDRRQVADSQCGSIQRRGEPDILASPSGADQGEAQQWQWGGRAAGDHGAGGRAETLGNPDGDRGEAGIPEARKRSGPAGVIDDGSGLPFWPPRPGERDAWAAILARWPDLAPAQPSVRRVADAGAGRDRLDLCLCHRGNRLRGLGNGVVPACAEAALRNLWHDAFGQWP